MRRRLLVLAVWLLGVAGLWRLLPPAPQAVFNVPGRLAGVTDAGVAIVFGEPEGGVGFRGVGPVTAWDVSTGRRLWTAYGPADFVFVWLTADGQRVLVWGSQTNPDLVDWTELRDVETGAVVGRFPKLAEVSPPDGRWAATWAPVELWPHQPRATDIWETATGRWVRRLNATQVDFSPDGRRVLSQGGGLAAVYDTNSGRLTDHPDPAGRRWSWMSDGRLIEDDGLVWDVDAHAVGGRFAELFDPNAHPLNSAPVGPWCIEFDRRPAVAEPSPPEVGWRLADGRWRRAASPAGYELHHWLLTDDGHAVVLFTARDRPAGAVGRWLARQHPALARFGLGDTDETHVVLDADTAATVARLPPCDVLRVSADGRRLFTESFRHDIDHTRVEVWNLPQRPSLRTAAALAAVWTVLAIGASRWLGRPAHKSHRTTGPAVPPA